MFACRLKASAVAPVGGPKGRRRRLRLSLSWSTRRRQGLKSGFFYFVFLHFPPPPPHIVQCFSTASEQYWPRQSSALHFEQEIGRCAAGVSSSNISDIVMYSEPRLVPDTGKVMYFGIGIVSSDIESRGNSQTDVYDSSHFEPQSPHVEACFSRSREQRMPLQSNALHFEHKIGGCNGISGSRLLWKI